MGLFTHSTAVSEDLRENGIRGRATVDKAEMAMAMGGVESSGFMRQKSVEQLASGEKTMGKYKLHLTVELPGREPYTAKVTLPAPPAKAKFMTGGSVVPVLVDPKKDDHIAIDWDGEFQLGTLSQMTASNPIMAAAMRGAGVDVAKISQMQAAAMAAGQTPGNVMIGGQLFGGSGAAPAAAPAVDPIDQLKKLAELRDSGVLTESEFAAQKAKLLAQ